VTRFVLASASPARRETLTRAGIRFEVEVSGVDEDEITAPTTAQLVQHLADLKAEDVAARHPPGTLVLGCDSMLELDDRPLGKPGTAQEAARRWKELRGSSGILYTGHTLIDVGRDARIRATVATTVRFAEVEDDEIDLYCGTGEPERVAGAFTVDGLGSWFVEAVDGDHHNVVGVSLPTLRKMLRTLGYRLADLGYPASRADTQRES
jgi:septum formation protein